MTKKQESWLRIDVFMSHDIDYSMTQQCDKHDNLIPLKKGEHEVKIVVYDIDSVKSSKTIKVKAN